MAKKTGTPHDEHFTILGKMLALMTKYGVWNIIKALILIVSFAIAMYSITHIDDLVQRAFIEQNENNLSHHDAVMKHRNEIKPKVDGLLEDVLDNINADRVFVLEFHNGTNNLSGLPFMYGEITYEVCRKGVEPVGDDYGTISLSRFSLPYHMNNYNYFIGSIDSLETMDVKLSYRMRSNNASYVCISNMYGVYNNIGYVGATYVNGNEPAAYENIVDELYMLSQKISTLLDASHIKTSKK